MKLSKETALYEKDAIKNGINNAAGTATKYVSTIDDNGIFVAPEGKHPKDNPNAPTGWRITDVLEMLRNGLSVFKAWYQNGITYLRIGPEYIGNQAAAHVLIGDGKVSIFSDEDPTTDTRYEATISEEGFVIWNGDDNYAEAGFSMDELRFSNHVGVSTPNERALEVNLDESTIKMWEGGSTSDENGIGVTGKNSDSPIVWLGVGSGGSNMGVYSPEALSNGAWLIAYNSDANQLRLPIAADDAVGGSANVNMAANGRIHISGGSSKRFKHDICDISASEIDPHKLYNLKVRQFIYNDDYLDTSDHKTGKVVPGFIAEEVYDIYPIASEFMNGKVRDWDVRVIVPAMLKLIQEQKMEIEELKKGLSK